MQHPPTDKSRTSLLIFVLTLALIVSNFLLTKYTKKKKRWSVDRSMVIIDDVLKIWIIKRSLPTLIFQLFLSSSWESNELTRVFPQFRFTRGDCREKERRGGREHYLSRERKVHMRSSGKALLTEKAEKSVELARNSFYCVIPFRPCVLATRLSLSLSLS